MLGTFTPARPPSVGIWTTRSGPRGRVHAPTDTTRGTRCSSTGLPACRSCRRTHHDPPLAGRIDRALLLAGRSAGGGRGGAERHRDDLRTVVRRPADRLSKNSRSRAARVRGAGDRTAIAGPARPARCRDVVPASCATMQDAIACRGRSLGVPVGAPSPPKLPKSVPGWTFSGSSAGRRSRRSISPDQDPLRARLRPTGRARSRVEPPLGMVGGLARQAGGA